MKRTNLTDLTHEQIGVWNYIDGKLNRASFVEASHSAAIAKLKKLGLIEVWGKEYVETNTSKYKRSMWHVTDKLSSKQRKLLKDMHLSYKRLEK